MPRRIRPIPANELVHLYQRCVTGRLLFKNEGDRRLYARLLRKNARRFGVWILAYALMPNHVHLLAWSADEGAITRCLKHTHAAFAVLVNRDRGERGPLFVPSPKAKVVPRTRVLRVVRYIERNPVHHGFVESALASPWTSARWRAGLRTEDWIVARRLKDVPSGDEWRAILESRVCPRVTFRPRDER